MFRMLLPSVSSLEALRFLENALWHGVGVFVGRKAFCSLVHERLTDCCMSMIYS